MAQRHGGERGAVALTFDGSSHCENPDGGAGNVLAARWVTAGRWRVWLAFASRILVKVPKGTVGTRRSGCVGPLALQRDQLLFAK